MESRRTRRARGSPSKNRWAFQGGHPERSPGFGNGPEFRSGDQSSEVHSSSGGQLAETGESDGQVERRVHELLEENPTDSAEGRSGLRTASTSPSSWTERRHQSDRPGGPSGGSLKGQVREEHGSASTPSPAMSRGRTNRTSPRLGGARRRAPGGRPREGGRASPRRAKSRGRRDSSSEEPARDTPAGQGFHEEAFSEGPARRSREPRPRPAWGTRRTTWAVEQRRAGTEIRSGLGRQPGRAQRAERHGARDTGGGT